jgi:MFS family permease
MSQKSLRFSAMFDADYRQLVWSTLALFLAYLAVAMPLPVLSLYVTRQLHYGNALGGLAVGIAFLSTILTRNYAGTLADRSGGKRCMARGLVIYTAACLLCWLSVWEGLSTPLSYTVLIAGRLLLGFGESLVLVGLLGWRITLAGPGRAGRAISLIGMGMYGAFAFGAPLGLSLFNSFGFGGLMLISTGLPLVGLLMIWHMQEAPLQSGTRESFWRVLGRIWRPGATVCLQGVGFAGLGAFISLYFLSKGWSYSGLGLSFFGAGFIGVRMLCGHLPDKIGGARVAIVSLAIEACGQYLLWTATSTEMALLGALLTGMGCSMVFPAMGAEVVKRVPPQLRGTAVGGFAAFQDIAYGATGPIAGIVADHFGYASVFLIGAVAAVLGVFMAVLTHREA